MASLKELRNRIGSVRNTQKITSAMKMVAAAKLRRAQEQAEASRPYAERMERMLGSLAAASRNTPGGPRLLTGTGSDAVQLVVVATADRGLCGAFNSSIVREARRFIEQKLADGKEVKILCVGRKGRDQLRRQFGPRIVDTLEDVSRPRPSFEKADEIGRRLLAMFEAGEFDVATLFYARFRSAISQIVTRQPLIPFAVESDGEAEAGETNAGLVYEYEPEQDEILLKLLPRNLSVQIYRALLENAASEHGARMSAMDSATRNAGDMIKRLSQVYNRTRQAAITKELIEIISAKEAM